tara:strand:+ start:218 stop:664 length:447 start_codon:yes stop_codon:yes gene_type:complete
MQFIEVDNSNIKTLYDLNLQLAEDEDQKELFTASRDSYHKEFLSKNSISWSFLVFDENIAIGFYIYYFKFASYLGAKVLYIEDIYLTKESSSLKNKTILLDHALKHAKDSNCCRVEMRVLKNFNIGYELIMDFGFQAINKWDVFRLEG